MDLDGQRKTKCTGIGGDRGIESFNEFVNLRKIMKQNKSEHHFVSCSTQVTQVIQQTLKTRLYLMTK